LPVAHGEGRYVAAPPGLERLEAEDQVILRYVNDNPNGSMNAIAGVVNEARNVVGIMPHPERAADPLLRETTGLGFFTSLARHADVVQGGVG